MKRPLALLAPHMTNGAKILMWPFLFVAALLFLAHTGLALFFPYALDYGEAPLLDQAMRLAAGQNIYRPDISSPPHTIANYPPLYVLLLAPFVAWLGPTFWVGRTISVLCALATALFLALIIDHQTKDRQAAVATGLIFLAIPAVVHWSTLLRIDFLALALSTAALYTLLRWPAARRATLAAALLLVAAIYTRQSYALAAPLAGFAWLWTQERRRALELALLVGGLALLLFLILNSLTGGGFFFNIVTANVNLFSLEWLGRHFASLGAAMPVLLLLGGLFLILAPRRLPAWPLFVFYLIGGVLSALTVGKIGANVNYFLELSAALSLVAGLFIFWSRGHAWREAALLVLLVLQTGLLMQASLERHVTFLTFRRQEAPALQALAAMVAEADGPVLADEHMGLLTTQERPLYLQPFEVTQLATTGRWDQSGLLSRIRNQEFPLILIFQPPFSSLQEDRWTPEMLAAIEQNYRPAQVLAGNVVYMPEIQSGVSTLAVSHDAGFSPDDLEVGPLRRVGQAPYVLQPQIAVNPLKPGHLAAAVEVAAALACDPPECRHGLAFYTSINGGVTWMEQMPFREPGNSIWGGQVTFGPDGTLYMFAVRDGQMTINRSTADNGAFPYEMLPANATIVSRTPPFSPPRLNVNPESGELFLSFAGRNRNNVGASFNRSADGGVSWSFTARPGEGIHAGDVTSGRALAPLATQIMFGQGSNVAAAWMWSPGVLNWPSAVWVAASGDGGESFAEPQQIGETWGIPNATSHQGDYYVLYRHSRLALSQAQAGQEQQLALAVSTDGGRTWTTSAVSGEVPLTFDFDKGAGVNVAPNGIIDVVFYAHSEGSADCTLNPQEWRDTYLGDGWVDTCLYDVHYTFSRDGGQSFSRPLQLNERPIDGQRFVRLFGRSSAAYLIAVASTDEYAYPIWIDTQGGEGTQAITVRIAR